MTLNLSGLELRRRLGRKVWSAPEPWGPDGWKFQHWQGDGVIIVSQFPERESGAEWIHASMSRDGRVPSCDEMAVLHRAVWPDGYAYQVSAPPDQHVNIHPNVLHLWGRADGKPVLPEFGMHGTI